ncbi:MAG: WD40 repeat domain-containing protein, partial [Methylococcales bacterium]
MSPEDHPLRLIQLLGHRYDGINAVAFSPDGKPVAGATSDSLIRIWEPATGKVLRILKGHEDSVNTRYRLGLVKRYVLIMK